MSKGSDAMPVTLCSPRVFLMVLLLLDTGAENDNPFEACSMKIHFRLLVSNRLRLFLIVALYFSEIALFPYYLIRSGGNLKGEGAACVPYEASSFLVYFHMIFLFLFFDYFRTIEDAGLSDVFFLTYKHKRSKLYSFFIFFLCSILFGAVFYIECLGWLKIGRDLNARSGVYYLYFTMLYAVFPIWIGIVFAYLYSGIRYKLVGYILVLVSGFLVSPLFRGVIRGNEYMGIPLYRYFCFFIIEPENDIGLNEFTYAPVNGTIFSRGLFLMSIGILLIELLSPKERRKIEYLITTGMLITVSVGLYMYRLQPASFYNANDAADETDSCWYTQLYYEDRKPIQEISPDFQVQSYQMNLEFRHLLNADVLIRLEENNSTEYAFTLYHLYEVDEVLDERGAPVDYKREEDGLIVMTENPVTEIRIVYHGGTANFYSNSRYINLPGYFAYYPIPGINSVFSMEKNKYVNNSLKRPVMFYVSVDADDEVYSNLNEIEKGVFEGETTVPTFLAGFVGEIETDNGNRIIYPELSSYGNPFRPDSEKDFEYVTDRMEAGMVLMIMPPGFGDTQTVVTEKEIITSDIFRTLAKRYQLNGTFEYNENTIKRSYEDTVSIYKGLIRGTITEIQYDYAGARALFDEEFSPYGIAPCSDDVFESYIKEWMGDGMLEKLLSTKGSQDEQE